jgi:hypothetical protein
MLQVRIDMKRNQTDSNDDSNMCIAFFEPQKRFHLAAPMGERLEVRRALQRRKVQTLDEWVTRTTRSSGSARW